MWVGHDSFISNGKVIYSFESLITLKQPPRNMRGRQIHLFNFGGNNVYNFVMSFKDNYRVFSTVFQAFWHEWFPRDIFAKRKHGIIHAKMVEGHCTTVTVDHPRIFYTVYSISIILNQSTKQHFWKFLKLEEYIEAPASSVNTTWRKM